MQDVDRKEAGQRSEDLALAHLQAAGLQLTCRNYRCRSGEIDLVMLDGKTLVLVEVRYRSDARYGGAAASVTYRKQRRLISAARHLLLTRRDLRQLPVRFDVVAIDATGAAQRVEWIKDAIRL